MIILRLFMALLATVLVSGCAVWGSDTFRPKGDYPVPPRIQGYTQPGACSGGASLSIEEFVLPDYPARAARNGVQGWTLVRLDVTPDGTTENVDIVLDAPDRWFASFTLDAVEAWRFSPPPDGEALTDCLVMIEYRHGLVRVRGG